MAVGDKTVAVDQTGVQQILQLLGGGKTKETQTSTGDTAALDAVLAQLMGQNSGATIESLMQQFAGKIPQVQAGMAASGGRMPAGQMSPQMQKLLSQMTLAAQAQLQQQELQKLQVAAQAAGTKAQVNSTQARTTQQQGGIGQKLAQIATINKMGGNLLGFDPINEGTKKLKSLLGMGGPATDSAGLTLGGTPAAPMNLDQSMGFFNGSNGAPSLGNFAPSALDFSSGFGGIDTSFNALDSAMNLGNFDFGGVGGLDLGLGFSYDPSMGGFGADMGLGGSGALSLSDSFSAGNAAVGTALPEVFSDVAGLLPGLSYLADPSKLGSAFEIGEGNVAKDLGEIASLGSAIGGIGSTLGMSMGGLAGLAPMLGPLGIALMGIAAAFGGEEDSDVTAAKELDALLFDKKDYDRAIANSVSDDPYLRFQEDMRKMGGANWSQENFNQLLEEAKKQSTPEYLQQQYAQYGATMGRDLEAAVLYQKWDGRLNPYMDYLGERGTNYYNQLEEMGSDPIGKMKNHLTGGGKIGWGNKGPAAPPPTTGNLFGLLNDTSSIYDRQYAYEQDALSTYKLSGGKLQGNGGRTEFSPWKPQDENTQYWSIDPKLYGLENSTPYTLEYLDQMARSEKYNSF